MTKDQPAPGDDYQRRESREGLLGLFEQTDEHCYLEAARKLFEPGDELTGRDILFLVEPTNKNPTGRPLIDDEAALIGMAQLVVMRNQTVWYAACEMAERNPGQSKDSTARRLARKYRTTGRYYEGVFAQERDFKRVLRQVAEAQLRPSPLGLITDLNPEGLPAVELMKHVKDSPTIIRVEKLLRNVKERFARPPLGLVTGLTLDGQNSAQFMRQVAEAQLRPSPLGVLTGLTLDGQNSAQFMRDCWERLHRSRRRD